MGESRSRLRSLAKGAAIPGWLLFGWEVADHLSRADFVLSKGGAVMRTVLSFLSDNPGLRLLLGVIWLTAVVLWPKRLSVRRKQKTTESGIEKAEPEPTIVIATPIDGDNVGYHHLIRGSVTPSNNALQVLVFSGDGLWHLQPRVNVRGPHWTVESTFGDEEKPGGSYNLIAVLGDELKEKTYKTFPPGTIKSNVVTVHRVEELKVKPCPNETLHRIADNDREQIGEWLKLISVDCVMHFGDVPYIDFIFWVYNLALVPVSIDDSIAGRISFYKDRQSDRWPMLRRATMENNRAKNCPFRGSHRFTIRQEVSPEEAALIERSPDNSEFLFGDLTITMHVEGSPGVRFGTQFTVEKKNGLWPGHPAMLYSDRESQAEPQAIQTNLIKVKSTLKQQPDGGHPVALYERDPAHPGGEVFVAGDTPVEAAITVGVVRAIQDGKLVIAE